MGVLEIREALEIVAFHVARDPVYLPIFQTLEAELARIEAADAALARARQMAMADSSLCL